MFIRAAIWRRFAFSLLLFPPFTYAVQRQRIALVLEGGGALGFAHIGALQWLEENRIPVDVVAGTSMGGLVGGLYAAGMSPKDIKDLVANVNWPAVLETQPEFQTLGFRRKQDRVSYPNLLNFGLRNGLSLPSGLNSGQLIDQQLDRVLLPYFSMTSFDDLPIPFRCVATDLVSGKEVHFDHGSLATAIRATISIPALFSPEADNGALYIDGGLVNNLPVDVAKSLHPDIVIAVYLDTGPFDPSSVESLVGVTGRSASIVIAANELHNMQAADVLLTADVKEFGSTDFTKSDKIAPRGYDAAQAKKQLLSNFALPPDEWQQYLASRSARIRKTAPAPEFTEVTGTSARNQRAIQDALASDLGKLINSDLLDRQLDRINAQGIFNSLQYTLIERNGKTGLAIRAEEKTNAPPFINLGAIVNGADPNDVRLGIAARLTFLNLGAFRSEWRTDVSFGNTYEIASEYYVPLRTSKWFVAPRASAGKSRFDLYDNRNRTAEYSLHRAGAGFDLGFALNRRAELRLGEDLVHHEADLKIGTPFAPNYARTWGDTSLRFEYFGQDTVVVPHRGLSAEARFDLHSSGPLAGGYRSAEAKLNWFAPLSEDGALFFTANGGSAFGAKSLGLESFALGGPFRLGAYGINEVLGNQFWLGQAGYSHRLFAFNPLFGGALYGLAFVEAGKMYGVRSTQNVPLDGSVVVVTKTAVGPIFFGTSMAGADRLKWWFGMGRVF